MATQDPPLPPHNNLSVADYHSLSSSQPPSVVPLPAFYQQSQQSQPPPSLLPLHHQHLQQPQPQQQHQQNPYYHTHQHPSPQHFQGHHHELPPPQLYPNHHHQSPHQQASSFQQQQQQHQFSSHQHLPSSSSSSSAGTPSAPSSPVATPGQHHPQPQPQPPRLTMANTTPLGLADIRPRADSATQDSIYEIATPQNGPSNYMTASSLYAFDWCKWKSQGNSAGKVAVGSYMEDGHNFIQILDTHIVNRSSPRPSLDFIKVAEATHSYPVTRLLWEPPSISKASTDLLATSGDHLRLWSLPQDPQGGSSPSATIGRRDMVPTKLTPLALLSNSKTPEHTAPLTSLDWNMMSPSLIITSSIDTTCTIWDIPSLTAKTQLIAHDKEVYDVRFCAGSVDVFVSCGQDGSVRMFDLRSLEHSTIIYEPTVKDERANGSRPLSPTTAQQTMSHPPPLMRLATSPHDTNLLATFAQDSPVVRILDVRQPGQALLELRGHGGSVNCVEWSPSRRGVLSTGGDDCQVLLWDLMAGSGSGSSSSSLSSSSSSQSSVRSPVSAWQCAYEVGNLSWVPALSGGAGDGEWLGVSAGRGVWGVKV